jgi:hypothetical protein
VFLINVQENTKTMMDIGAGVGSVVTEEPKMPSSVNLVIEDVESKGESNTVGEAKLVAVPEASPAKSASRWSKKRAGDTDNNPNPLSLNISNCCIQTNLSSVGIHLG